MSAYDAAFESAWYKWGQAMVHAQALRADIDAVNEDGSADPIRAFRAHDATHQPPPGRHRIAGHIVEDRWLYGSSSLVPWTTRCLIPG